MTAQRSWWPLIAVCIIACATVGLIYWAVHRAGVAPMVQTYHEKTDEANLRIIALSEQRRQHGRQLFISYCTLCHGTSGQGLIGPNLRDDHWIHGSNLQQISESIANGNPNAGMAAWKPVLSPDDLHDLVAYLVSLQGSEDGSGKPPQGVSQPMDWLKAAKSAAAP